MRQYIALIHKDAGSDYGVSFPDLPGVATAGVDLDDARRMAEEALALHLEGMEADDEPVPEPSSLEAIMADPENREGVAVLINGPRQIFTAVRVNVTMPEDDLARIDRFASEHGYTRSGFLLHAAKREMSEPATGDKERIVAFDELVLKVLESQERTLRIALDLGRRVKAETDTTEAAERC